MVDMFSGKSPVFAILLALLLLVVLVAVKVVNVMTWTPGRVRGELNDVFTQVQNISPMSLRKAEFLILWGDYRLSEDCSDAVVRSRDYPGNGFDGNTYVVVYSDSVEFPGFPTFHREIRIEKSMSSRD